MKINIRNAIHNFTLINILLVVFIIALSKYIFFSSTNFKINYSQSAKVKEKISGETPSTSNFPSLSDFLIIGELNLFHPERKIPVEKKEEKPLPTPEFVLYGTLISENLSLAYLEDLKEPYSTPGRGKRQITLRQGDTLSGFTLKEIETDKVVMVRGEERVVIDLAESRRKYKGPASTSSTQTQASTSTQPPAQPAKIEKQPTRPASRKQIDQDVFNFFERRKQEN